MKHVFLLVVLLLGNVYVVFFTSFTPEETILRNLGAIAVYYFLAYAFIPWVAALFGYDEDDDEEVVY